MHPNWRSTPLQAKSNDRYILLFLLCFSKRPRRLSSSRYRKWLAGLGPAFLCEPWQQTACDRVHNIAGKDML
jgi:hypothetical protein